MTLKTCMVCERPYPRERCTIIELTPAEEAVLAKRGTKIPEEFVYCARCWGIIKDPEIGPRLLRDTAERQMLKLGVAAARAQKIADRYYTRLRELQRQRHHKVH